MATNPFEELIAKQRNVPFTDREGRERNPESENIFRAIAADPELVGGREALEAILAEAGFTKEQLMEGFRDAPGLLQGKVEEATFVGLREAFGHLSAKEVYATFDQISGGDLLAEITAAGARADEDLLLAAHKESLETGELSPFGRNARSVWITDYGNTQRGIMGQGTVFGIENDVAGRLIVFLPETAIEDLSPEERELYENGQEIEISFQDAEGRIDPSLTEGDPSVSALVFFEGTTNEDINRAMRAENLQFGEDIIEGFEEAGEDVSGLGITIDVDAELTRQLALTNRGQFLGGDDPASVFFESRGAETREGLTRIRQQRPFGDEQTAGEVDPVTGRRIGEVQEILPFFTQDHLTKFFVGMPSEELREWQELMFESGRITRGDIGYFSPGDFSDPTFMAMEQAMTHSNLTGILDGTLVTDPSQALQLSLRNLGTLPRPVPEFNPSTTRVLPSAAEMFNVVNDYARSRYGRPMDEAMAAPFVDTLFDRYGSTMDQLDLVAEQDHIQQGIDAGFLPSPEQRGLLANAPNEIHLIDPEAEFRRAFDQKFAGVDRTLEEGAEHRSLRNSLLGSALTSKQMP